MIDLHSHLLPGIDDGATDLNDALELARIAVADGITHMVCTPHIHPGRYDNTPDSICNALKLLQHGLRDQQIPLRVAAAAEVRFDMEIMIGIKTGRLPLLGHWEGKQVLLLELPHGEVPFAADRLTGWLLQQDILPMIAHPERNRGLMRDPALLKPFIQQGCLLQVTAGSVAGQFGDNARELAEQLLKQGLVTILASDAHNRQHRPPVLSAGLDATTRLLGAQQAEKLVFDHPWTLARSHFQTQATS